VGYLPLNCLEFRQGFFLQKLALLCLDTSCRGCLQFSLSFTLVSSRLCLFELRLAHSIVTISPFPRVFLSPPFGVIALQQRLSLRYCDLRTGRLGPFVVCSAGAVCRPVYFCG
jgi:hypothetical protein